jgi:signal transduction histidine kinase
VATTVHTVRRLRRARTNGVERVANLEAELHRFRDLYNDLSAKYHKLAVERHQRSRKQTAFQLAAYWALRSGASGWALLREGAMVFSNSAFHQLGRNAAGTLRRWTAPGVVHAPLDSGLTLAHLVSQIALRVPTRGTAVLQERLVADDGVVIEVTAERSQVNLSTPAVLVRLRDISDLARAEGELQAAQIALLRHERLRAAGELAVGIGHDVNNILGSLALRLEPLARDPACMQTHGRNVDAMKRIVQEGMQLVRKLNAMAREEQGAIESIDLRESITSAVEIAQSGLRLRAAETGIDIRIQVRLPRLPRVAGVTDDLRHVFVNLLINARDAMPRGGTITITARKVRQRVVVTVEDEGTGIEPAHLPRLFDAFFTTKGAGGTGLGLAMARSTMERIGGSIAARNLDEGGAVFELVFRTPRARSSS